MSTSFYCDWLSLSKKHSWKRASSEITEWISTRQKTTDLRTSAFWFPIRDASTSEVHWRFSINCWPSEGLRMGASGCWSCIFWMNLSLFCTIRSKAWSLGGYSVLRSGSRVYCMKSRSQAITSCSRRSSATWFVMHWCYGAISGEYARRVAFKMSSLNLSRFLALIPWFWFLL